MHDKDRGKKALKAESARQIRLYMSKINSIKSNSIEGD